MADHTTHLSNAPRSSAESENGVAVADRLNKRLCAFAKALLDPTHPVPRGLVGPDGKPSVRRFSVYRNNVVAGLVEALKHAFPAVLQIVGDDFFSAAARVYVVREPPTSPIMLNYGANFPTFLKFFEPAASLPYLHDVARVERAWIEAYHAAEAEPIDPASFLSVSPEQLPKLLLMLHPSLRVVRSSFPAASIWQMNIEGGFPAALDIHSGGEDVLVMRPVAEVSVQRLPVGAAIFIEKLVSGETIVEATKAALNDDPKFSLASALTGLLAANAVIGWKPPQIVIEGVPWSQA